MTTTENAPTPEGQGENQGHTTGADTGTLTSGKSFTQAQLDSIVQSRLAEERTKLKSRFEANLAAELEKAKSGIDQLVEERLAARENEMRLEAARSEIAAKFGLTQIQAQRLTGTTAAELEADATQLFGKVMTRDSVVRTVAEKYGLTEKQAARLSGDTEEELSADAEELFGAKKKPVILQPGPTGDTGPVADLMNMTPAEVRANRAKLWPTQ